MRLVFINLQPLQGINHIPHLQLWTLCKHNPSLGAIIIHVSLIMDNGMHVGHSYVCLCKINEAHI